MSTSGTDSSSSSSDPHACDWYTPDELGATSLYQMMKAFRRGRYYASCPYQYFPKVHFLLPFRLHLMGHHAMSCDRPSLHIWPNRLTGIVPKTWRSRGVQALPHCLRFESQKDENTHPCQSSAAAICVIETGACKTVCAVCYRTATAAHQYAAI